MQLINSKKTTNNRHSTKHSLNFFVVYKLFIISCIKKLTNLKFMDYWATDYRLQVARGFSLIELVIVLGIFGLLSTTVLSNYSLTNTKTSLDNLAHQIALSIRQAQVYGLSVSESSVGSSVFPGYGVYFSTTINNAFKFFADTDNNKQYNGISCGVVGTECVENIIIKSGDFVRMICANSKTTSPNCTTLLDSVNIVFVRPNPDAYVFGIPSGGGPITQYSDAEIIIESPGGFQKTLVVWSTGHIAIE